MTEHLDWRNLISAAPDTPAPVISALDAYFAPFAEPPIETGEDGKPRIKDGHPCLKCGEPLTGFAAMMLGKGGFQWGLVHGEGNCAGCGWPARAHHYIKDESGDLMTLRNVVLQYHPDAVTQRSPKRASASEAA